VGLFIWETRHLSFVDLPSPDTGGFLLADQPENLFPR
jgi:hypothetical protein